tara:strand:- start:1219 stop:1989 length:771 start_codon:yes stop_codon:yes gene_type:complete
MKTKIRKNFLDDWYLDDQKKQQIDSIEYGPIITERWKNFSILLDKSLRDYKIKSPVIKILDAGCGDGNNINFLVDYFSNKKLKIKITALDYNEIRLKKIPRQKNIYVEQGSLLHINHPNEKFDVILCSHVIEHIEEPVQVINELKRVLHKKGHMIISVPNEGCFLAQLRNRVFQRKILKSTDHKHFFTAKTFLSIAENSGLELKYKILFEGFFFPHSGIDRRLRKFIFWRKLMNSCSKYFSSQCGGITLLFKTNTK